MSSSSHPRRLFSRRRFGTIGLLALASSAACTAPLSPGADSDPQAGEESHAEAPRDSRTAGPVSVAPASAALALSVDGGASLIPSEQSSGASVIGPFATAAASTGGPSLDNIVNQLPAGLQQALKVGGFMVSTISTVSTWIQMGKTVLTLLGVLPAAGNDEAAAYRALIAELDHVEGNLSWKEEEHDRETRFVTMFVAAWSAQRALQHNEPILSTTGPLPDSLAAITAAEEADAFLRSANEGNTDGPWKSFIGDRPGVVQGQVADWRLALPQVLQFIGQRIAILAAADPTFNTAHLSENIDELNRHRAALQSHLDQMNGEVRCHAAYDDGDTQFGIITDPIMVNHANRCPYENPNIAPSGSALSRPLPNTNGDYSSGPALLNPVPTCSQVHFHVACADINTGLSATRDVVVPYGYPLDLARKCGSLTGVAKTICMSRGNTDYRVWHTANIDSVQDSLKRQVLHAMSVFDVKAAIDSLSLIINGGGHDLTSERQRIPAAGASNLCLAANAPVPTPGATVSLATCVRDDPAQSWRYDRASQTIIESTYGLCLEVKGGDLTPGAPAQLAACTSPPTDAQRWTYDPNSHVLLNALGNVLDVQGGTLTAGTPAWTWTANGGPAQQWQATGLAFPTTSCVGAPTLPRQKVRSDLADPWNNAGSASVAVLASTGTTMAYPGQWLTLGGWDDSIQWLSGDFDGNGLADLASVWNDGGSNTIAVRASTGSTFTGKQWATQVGGSYNNDMNQWLPGDFDGDGRADIAEVTYGVDPTTHQPTTNVSVFLSTGSGFAGAQPWAQWQGGWATGAQWVTGDFNGDGRADIATIWNDGGYNTISVRQSTGTAGSRGFTVSQWAIRQGGWLESSVWRAGDFDGDGLADIAAAWNNAGYTNIGVFKSTGSAAHGFYAPVQWPTVGGWAGGSKWAAGDFDGDGLTDLANVWNNGATNSVAVRRSTGAASFAVMSPSQTAGSWLDSSVWCPGKFH